MLKSSTENINPNSTVEEETKSLKMRLKWQLKENQELNDDYQALSDN